MLVSRKITGIRSVMTYHCRVQKVRFTTARTLAITAMGCMHYPSEATNHATLAYNLENLITHPNQD